MVGSLGETALSGVYLASQITTFLQMFTMGTSAAMTVLAAQYWGKGDIEKRQNNHQCIALRRA